MPIASLDTQLIIWGIRKVASPGQESKIFLAENLLKVLDAEKTRPLLTSITVAEASAQVPDELIPSFMRDIQHLFGVIPFDALAAHYYQKLYKAHCCKIPEWKDEGYRRVNIVTDMKILATALSRRVEVFYTDNVKDFLKIAHGFDILISYPPDPAPEQLDLPLQ